MATPFQPVAKCVTQWLYEQASAILKKLRSFIEKIITLIDTLILKLKAEIAAMDVAVNFTEFLWGIYEGFIEKIKNALLSSIEGPDFDFCPEFYAYITDPAIALLEASLAGLLPYKERYVQAISFSAYLNVVLSYWEGTKAQLSATLDVIDDAIYNALILEAANAVP